MIQFKIHNQELDLFDDESITLTSKVKDPQFVDRIWTDFTHSFNVPASENNNQILHHYYRFNVIEGTQDKYYDYRIKQRGAIEINYTTFRDGYIKLNSAKMELDKVVSYNITFFGSIAGFKDLIGEYTLPELNWDEFNHVRDGDSVWEGLSYAGPGVLNNKIIYPLISKTRRWDEAALNTGIFPNNFSPAILVTEVLANIEAEGELTFSSAFFQEDHFTNLFLYCPRELSAEETTKESDFQKVGIYSSPPPTGEYVPNIVSYPNGVIDMTDFNNNSSYQSVASLHVDYNAGGAQPFDIIYYVNGLEYDRVSNIQGSGTHTFFYTKGQTTINDLVRFYVVGYAGQTEQNMNIKLRFEFQQQGGGNPIIEVLYTNWDLTYFLGDELKLALAIPNIKIIDFITGILKLFNLTLSNIDPADGTYHQRTFFVEPYDVWLTQGRNPANGNTVDLTKLIDIKTHEIITPLIPSEVSYRYQDPEAFLNERFKIISGQAYGDASIKSDKGADEPYEIEVEFENLLWEKQSEPQELHIGWVTDDPIPAYVNPQLQESPLEDRTMLFYWSGEQACDIGIQGSIINGGANMTSYKFCNSYYSPLLTTALNQPTDPPTNSLNYGSELNSYTLTDETVSLYSLYHKKYLSSIFAENLRAHKYRAILSHPDIVKLKLNDTVKIHDIYYHINLISANLTSGEVNLTLVNINRQITNLPPPGDTIPPTIGVLSIVPNPEPPDTEDPIMGTISYSNLTGNEVTIHFSATDNKGVDGFKLYLDTVLHKNLIGTATSTILTGLTEDTSYDVYMTASDEAGNTSADSNTINFTTLDTSSPVITSSTAQQFWQVPSNGDSAQHSYTIQATNNPNKFKADNLPPTSILDVNSGVITDNSSNANQGNWNVVISASNNGGVSYGPEETINFVILEI